MSNGTTTSSSSSISNTTSSSSSSLSTSSTINSSSSRSDAQSYIVFKGKVNQNSGNFAPMDIHPVHPWLLYTDSDNNIIIQNYVDGQKILNFSITQHEEERREQQTLQKRIPTLASLPNPFALTSTTSSNQSGSLSNVNGSGASTASPTSGTGSVASSGGSPTSNSPTSPLVATNFNTLSPNIGQSQTMHRSPNNTLGRPNIDTSGRSATIGEASDIEKFEKLGQIRFLQFYDRYTRQVKDRKPKTSLGKLNLQSNNQKGSNIGLDDYIVIVADNRIVFLNYHSQRLRDVKIPIFDFKPPTSIEFFSNSPLVAFGGSDATVRLWNVDKWELERPLVGGHQKTNASIVRMRAIELEGDFLASSGSDGVTCIWNIRTGTIAAQFPKLHDIIDLAYDHFNNHLLALTGQDRMIVQYDFATLREVARISCGKRDFQSIDISYHPRFQHTDLLLSSKSPAQIVFMSRTPSTGAKEHLIDFDQLIGSKKEKMKLYKVIQHPVLPHLHFCWVNRNVYLISTMATSIPNFAATNSIDNSMVYFPNQGFLNSLPLSNIVTSEKTIIKQVALPTNEPYRIEISTHGKYLSIFSLFSGTYVVYEIGTFKQIEKGSSLDIAWSGRGKDGSEKFGRLERIFEAADPVKKKKLLSLSVKKPKEVETASKILLKTKEFSTNISQELLLHTNDDRMMSGLLLGIYSRECKDGAGSGSTSTSSSSSSSPTGSSTSVSQETPIQPTAEEVESKSFQLYDWWTLQPIGDSLPPPLKVYWDLNQTHCVFAYTHYFCVFKLRPSIHLLSRWPITLTSALWHNNTLFFTTPNDIQCLFPHKHESAPLILSSSSGVTFPEDLYDNSSGSLANYKPNQTFSLLPQYRPFGSIALVGISNEALIAVDPNYRFYSFPLTHYLLKFFMLVQQEMIESAVKCASMVDPKYHYLMAKFLTVRGHPQECLTLGGISNYLKFLICINNEAYESSLELVQLLADTYRSHQTLSTTDNIPPEDNSLSYLARKCIDIGHLCQSKNDIECSQRAFKIATTLDPHAAYQELALHYCHHGKKKELLELQQSIQQRYPIEYNLISLLLENSN
ncbi:hypothetical protein DFA_10619 [Cavenderia fasciculata]|uniref:WD40 repeat-containing protein n=1 Tax=Cavenderia fasciculata TaxID=261658 RepID=F4QAQ7_CACFS|nr:uncharacterized protein DFA_10619 [Cavenderia fasciculata]EGG15776.1 hypothetical protein DFA_10619 [Cavenderia fasciculata]|eukprot:XP_004354523.1 hypothetical protein DFA_10619 [Cavenderia fasciculata]